MTENVQGGGQLSASKQTAVSEALSALVKREQNLMARTQAQQLFGQLKPS